MLPDDSFWAAKRVMAFTDNEIRAIVKSGQYSDSRAEAWIAKCLIERRNKIGKTYLRKVLPLDRFRVEGPELKFEDLEVQYGFVPSRSYRVQWSEYDNSKDQHRPMGTPVGNDFRIPPAVAGGARNSHFAAKIAGEEPAKAVTVYFRKENEGLRVVGIDRDWPRKVIVHPERKRSNEKSRYSHLHPPQQKLFDAYAVKFDRKSGRNWSPQEYYDSLSISERTTFDAVTHALMNSKLTAEDGQSLGTALDLVDSLERASGEYVGRPGDEEFRLYVSLKPGAREILERSVEFHRDKDNTVYHVGYPISYRQNGKPPSIQFSLAKEETKADIDVDYRSSKLPRALWDGHLTAANSDVRSGKNYQHHSRRWRGLVNWWEDLFGKLPKHKTDREHLLRQPPKSPTPTPPDREHDALIEEVHDAAQEFLTDWLVRRNLDHAMTFVSRDVRICDNLDEEKQVESFGGAEARSHILDVMRQANQALPRPHHLTEAIRAAHGWHPAWRLVEHGWEN